MRRHETPPLVRVYQWRAQSQCSRRRRRRRVQLTVQEKAGEVIILTNRSLHRIGRQGVGLRCRAPRTNSFK